MLYSGSFLFVGTLQASEFGAQTPAAIKVYNIKAGSEDTLEGHKVCWNLLLINFMILESWEILPTGSIFTIIWITASSSHSL